MSRLTTPVTIITGFLGSGKATLINRILREMHGERLAVIEYEFGAVGVDAEFLVTDGSDTIIQLANGCLCCTVRGDLARALNTLSESSQRGGFVFDRVLIETTGIADPGPIIQSFLAETAILTRFHLDGVVTLADSVHAFSQLDKVENRAHIAYADRLLLTKCDLATTSQCETISERLSEMNPRATLLPVDLHNALIADLLQLLFDAQGYSFDYVSPQQLERPQGRRVPEDTNFRPPAPRHRNDIVSLVFESNLPLDLERLNLFFDRAAALRTPAMALQRHCLGRASAPAPHRPGGAKPSPTDRRHNLARIRAAAHFAGLHWPVDRTGLDRSWTALLRSVPAIDRGCPGP